MEMPTKRVQRISNETLRRMSGTDTPPSLPWLLCVGFILVCAGVAWWVA